MGANNAPKAGCVVGFEEVSELVNDDVVYYEYWRLDETPIEIEIVFRRTGAPAVTAINDLGRSIGPPWRQDDKYAAIVGWLALRAIAR